MAVSYDKINLIVNFPFFLLFDYRQYGFSKEQRDKASDYIKMYIYVNLELPEVITL